MIYFLIFLYMTGMILSCSIHEKLNTKFTSTIIGFIQFTFYPYALYMKYLNIKNKQNGKTNIT